LSLMSLTQAFIAASTHMYNMLLCQHTPSWKQINRTTPGCILLCCLCVVLTAFYKHATGIVQPKSAAILD